MSLRAGCPADVALAATAGRGLSGSVCVELVLCGDALRRVVELRAGFEGREEKGAFFASGPLGRGPGGLEPLRGIVYQQTASILPWCFAICLQAKQHPLSRMARL